MYVGTPKARCKAALAKYKDLMELTAEAQVKMLELLMHPDCPDAEVLKVIHTRRKAMEQMRAARDTLVRALHKAGMAWEANALAKTRI